MRQDPLTIRLLLVAAGVHLVFAIWPGIDLAVARAFLRPDGGFLLTGQAWAESLRNLIWNAGITLLWLSLLMLAATLVRGPAAQTPVRLWGFSVALFLLGPGLLVNGILKQFWGRARPADVDLFGGTRAFTPPFEMADQCLRNCSFVSGEAAAAAVLGVVAFVWLWLWRGRAGAGRTLALAGLSALFALTAGLRLANGRHFLSDVVFAGLFMLILGRLLFLGFGLDRLAGPLSLRAVLGDLAGAGGRLWRLVTRRR